MFSKLKALDRPRRRVGDDLGVGGRRDRTSTFASRRRRRATKSSRPRAAAMSGCRATGTGPASATSG